MTDVSQIQKHHLRMPVLFQKTPDERINLSSISRPGNNWMLQKIKVRNGSVLGLLGEEYISNDKSSSEDDGCSRTSQY
jgi:hypothetical protein